MTSALWGERPLPSVLVGVADLGDWELTTAADLSGARAQLRDGLRHGMLPTGADGDDVAGLLLAFEELASNGLRHGRAPVRVRVSSTRDGWLIDASDAATDRHPAPAVDRDPAHGGLGLYLVARLSAAHGWIVRSGRKHVWACVRPA